MNRKKINFKMAGFLGGIIIILIMTIGHVVYREEESLCRAGSYIDSVPIRDSITYRQYMEPLYSYIDTIGIQISRDGTFGLGAEGQFYFAFYDHKGKLLYQEEIPVNEMVSKDYTYFPVKSRVSAGKECYYELSVTGCEGRGVMIRMWDTIRTGLTESRSIVCKENTIDQYATVATYTYAVAPDLLDIVIYLIGYEVLLVLIGALMKKRTNKSDY